MAAPILTDGVIRLDGFTLADASAHLAGEDEEMARRLGWWPKRSTPADFAAALARWKDGWDRGGPTRAFAVRDAPSGQLFGMCELRLDGDQRALGSYAINAPFRCRGYATRALVLACRWAAGALALERVELYIEPDNLASRAVARKAGFREEALLRDHTRIGDSLRDMVRAALILSEGATMAVFRCTNCGSMNRVPDPLPAGAPRCGRCKQPLTTDGAPQEVTDGSFDEAIHAAPVPVVVDFWAPWCGPCRIAGPILDAIARANAGRILVLKLNTDDNPGVAGRYQITGIPSFFVFRDGKVVAQQSGLPPRAAFERWVAEATTGAPPVASS